MKILNKYTLTEIDYKNPTEKELNEIFNFYIEQWNEENPGLPDPTFEKFKYDFKYSRENEQKYKFLLHDANGKLIARSEIKLLKHDCDAPQAKKDDASFKIRIDEKFRRKGVVRELLLSSINKIQGLGIKKINTYSNLESGQSFCEKLDGKITARGFISYLDIEKNDWKKTQKLFDEIKSKNPDIRVETHLELKEEDIPGFVKIDTVFMEEISKYSEESNFDKDFTIRESTKYIKEGLKKGQKHIYTYLRNRNDEIIGLSDLIIDPKSPLRIFQGMTGITKDYRGRGLAKLVKAGTLLRLKDNHIPGSVITTYNDEDNTVMRKINESIGFKSIPIWKKYTFGLQELREKLRERTQDE